MELADSALKISKKGIKALNNTDIINHEENKKESSFTLKNRNLARMNELVFGTKRRQSNTDNNIMKILNQSVSTEVLTLYSFQMRQIPKIAEFLNQALETTAKVQN
jgi:transcription termination factor NusB